MAETLKRGHDDRTVAETVDRDGLYRAQTPQGFDFAKILAAHQALRGRGFTDDAALAEAMGLSVVMIEGDEDNLKVTTEPDLERAERLLTKTETPDVRVGNGFDVHRLGDGDHVWLCGVKVDHDAGLVGHSDADVGLHALTDALLGAIGARRHRPAFPAQRPTMARRVVRQVRCPCCRADQEGGRPRSACRCDAGAGETEGRPASRPHAPADCRHPGYRPFPGQPEGDDDRRAGLCRPRRGYRGPGHGHRRDRKVV